MTDFLPSHYKDLSSSELESLFSDTTFKTVPFQHQLAFLAWAVCQDRVMCWLDIGTGKSLASLYLASLWGCNRILIVCPNAVLSGWCEQIEQHTESSYEILSGTAQERQDKLDNSQARIFILNYEGLKYLFGRKVTTDRGSRFIPQQNIELPQGLDCLIIDEIHHVKDFQAVQSVIAAKLSTKVSNVIGLTGTPIRALDDLWMQYYVLDLGKTLGMNYYGFLRKHFKKGFYEWKPKDGTKEAILSLIEPVTMRYSRTECLDLPEKTYEVRRIRPTEKQKTMLNTTTEDIYSIYEQGKLNKLILSNKMLDMSRVAGGFYKTDTGLKRFKKNPKLDELVRLLEWEVPDDTQVLVFHHFVEEGRLIETALKKKEITYASLRGEIKDRDGELKKFKEGAARILIANPRCGGEGLNLFNASIAVFYGFAYEGGVSRQQAEGRIWRANQERPCLFVDLLMEDTFDQQIYEAVMKNVDVSGSMMDWIAGRNTNG